MQKLKKMFRNSTKKYKVINVNVTLGSFFSELDIVLGKKAIYDILFIKFLLFLLYLFQRQKSIWKKKIIEKNFIKNTKISKQIYFP